MRVIVLVFFNVWICYNLSAQNDNEANSSKELGLTVGWNKSLLKDLNFSPLNYQQKGEVYSIDYTSRKGNEKSIFKVQLDFLRNSLNTVNVEHFTSTLIIGNLAISYLKKLKNMSPSFQYYLGGEYRTNFNYIDYEEQEAFSFLVSHGFNLKAAGIYSLNEQSSVSAALSVPLITLVVRPPYNSFDEELQENLEKPLRLLTNGEVMMLNRYQYFNLTITCNYQFSEKIGARLNYGLLYQNLNEVNQIIQLQQSIKAGITYQF